MSIYAVIKSTFFGALGLIILNFPLTLYGNDNLTVEIETENFHEKHDHHCNLGGSVTLMPVAVVSEVGLGETNPTAIFLNFTPFAAGPDGTNIKFGNTLTFSLATLDAAADTGVALSSIKFDNPRIGNYTVGYIITQNTFSSLLQIDDGLFFSGWVSGQLGAITEFAMLPTTFVPFFLFNVLTNSFTISGNFEMTIPLKASCSD